MMNHFLQDSLIAGCLFISVTLHGVSVDVVNAEQEEAFLVVMEQVAKIENLKKRVAAARKELILLYHTIGQQVLAFQAYHHWSSRKAFDEVSAMIQSVFPELKGFSSWKLKYMCKCAASYPDRAFVEEMVAKLPWSHIETILQHIREKKAQLFYIKKAMECGWSRYTLVKQMQSALHTQEEHKAEPEQADKAVKELVKNGKKTTHSAGFSAIKGEGERLFSQIIEQGAQAMHLKKIIADAGAEFTLLYHRIGTHIVACQADRQWSVYKVLTQVKKAITSTFPNLKGLSERNLQYMRKFAQMYTDEAFVKEIAAHLPWVHIAAILERVREKEYQLFYIKQDRECKWSCKGLIKQIQSALHMQEGHKDEPPQETTHELVKDDKATSLSLMMTFSIDTTN